MNNTTDNKKLNTQPTVTQTVCGKCEKWHDNDGRLHRDKGPARIDYYRDGTVWREEYRQHGKEHRDGAPAYIEYNPDGTIAYEAYWQHGQRHREDGPARIEYNRDGTTWSETYYREGQLHRDGTPAHITYNQDGTISSEQYWQHGKQQSAPTTMKDGEKVYVLTDGKQYYVANTVHGLVNELERWKHPNAICFDTFVARELDIKEDEWGENYIIEAEQYYDLVVKLLSPIDLIRAYGADMLSAKVEDVRIFLENKYVAKERQES
ncbi:toxin-antitoxin system YwqK family antitoxin [Actinotignum urinale]|uniref:toxin-antitoxin system YwqK family antitoxin n=1 Tax=Actinotignum urinale TaxID=190146 RepID=UPI00370DA1DE